MLSSANHGGQCAGTIDDVVSCFSQEENLVCAGHIAPIDHALYPSDRKVTVVGVQPQLVVLLEQVRVVDLRAGGHGERQERECSHRREKKSAFVHYSRSMVHEDGGPGI